MKKNSLALAVVSVVLSGCVAAPTYPTRVYVQPPPSVAFQTPAPQSVVSVFVDPPLYQPPPVRVQWAPPPMLVEVVPFQSYPGAVWTGGYWVWEGNWVWAHGRWSTPPQLGYGWINPYYENRGGSVLFVNGFWAAPGVSFVQPALSLNIGFAPIAVGVIAGIRPIGPDGVFVPAPPGSRLGLIIPAPLGTAPAVVVSAPAVINEGMRVRVSNTINNTSTTNITNNNTVNNNSTTINNVTIVAPASATASGQAVNKAVPAQAHLAAALPPLVRTVAPNPLSSKAIPAYLAGNAPSALPAPQIVRTGTEPVPARPQIQEQQRVSAPSALSAPTPAVNLAPALNATHSSDVNAAFHRDRVEPQAVAPAMMQARQAANPHPATQKPSMKPPRMAATDHLPANGKMGSGPHLTAHDNQPQSVRFAAAHQPEPKIRKAVKQIKNDVR